jgi:RND family efflux transporter MFP subunit
MQLKKIIITIVSIAAVVALGIKGKSLLKERQQQVANAPLPKTESMHIELVKPHTGILQNREPFTAQVASDKSIKLSTKLAGFVKKVYVEESQMVHKGDLLVQIDATELHSALHSLQALLATQKSDLAVAKSIYNRNKKLYDAGGLAKEKLDLSRVALSAKKSQLENTIQKIAQLKHQLTYLRITAPFDGQVDTLFMHEGDLAAAGKPILSMSNNIKKLIFSFAPKYLKKIKTGQKVFDNQNNQIGEIKSIYPTARNGLATAEIKLEKSTDLPLGSSINIHIQTQQAKGCILPDDTLIHKKEGTYVMVYTNNHFQPLKVDVKMHQNFQILVSPCPHESVARGSEVKLSALGAYKEITVTGAKDE